MAISSDMSNLDFSGMNPGMMGLAQGLLAAARPSRLPVGLGQALAQGFQSAQQSQSQAMQDQLLRLRLAAEAAALRQMLSGTGSTPSLMQYPMNPPAFPSGGANTVPQQVPGV
jgi:hypothetical protein